MKNYIVYIHISPGGKRYIGITHQKPEMRWRHGDGYKHNKYFYNAIQKYGWENIKHEIFCENLTKEEAEQKEIELIKQHKSNNQRYGYNIEYGGNLNKKINERTRKKMRQSHLGYITSEETKQKLSLLSKGRKFSEETKQKMREKALGRHHSEEIKEIIRKKMLGRTSPRKGVLLSEEIKNKISKSKKEKHFHWTNEEKIRMGIVRSKPVICIETGIIYYGAKEAERQININNRHIGECCKGVRKTAGKLHWEFYKEQ